MTIFLLVDIVNKFRSTILDKDLLFTLSTHHLYIHITYLLVCLRMLVNVYLLEDNIELQQYRLISPKDLENKYCDIILHVKVFR